MYKKFLKSLRVLAVALFMMVSASALSSEASAVILEQSGDGMCFYNWVVAPELPSYRPSGYDYSLISCMPVEGMNKFTDYVCVLLYSDKTLFFDGEDLRASTGEEFSIVQYFYTPSVDVASILGISSGVWQFYEEGSFRSFTSPSVNWSDYNVYNTSNEIISPARDVIPLDGYNIIRWDGIKSEVSISNNLASVGSSLPVPVDAYYVTGTYYNSAPGYSRGVNAPASGFIVSDDNWRMGTDSTTYVKSDFSSDSLLFYSSSLNFGMGYFTQLLAYKPQVSAPVGPDFTDTELIIASSDYDFQSADFEVGWSHLPSIPYPDHYQYYISARLNDGSLPTHPYTYIGSSDDPPSGDLPVWFRFEDLQPETAYSVTFDLRYTTGSNVSFSDSVSSGVTTTVSFTTLSDGSISDGDKAIIGAIQDANRDHEQWLDSEMGSAVGDLGEDTAATDKVIDDLNEQEEALQDDAYARFQEVSSTFTGFDGTVGAGIGLAGTLFSRFFNVLGPYKIIYTFPLLLGLAMVIIGRLGRSSVSLEDKDHDQFIIDGW